MREDEGEEEEDISSRKGLPKNEALKEMELEEVRKKTSRGQPAREKRENEVRKRKKEKDERERE